MSRPQLRYVRRLALLAVAAGGLAAVIAAGTAAAPAPRGNAPRRGAAATRPGARPEPYPNAALVRACGAAADALRKRLDGTFAIRVDPPFVTAGNMTPRRLGEYTRDSVLRPARAMWAGYFDKKPDKVVTVLLFVGEEPYRTWAKKLFNDTDVPHFGYYTPTSRTLVMNINTGTGTLVHELTHALIVYDFPTVPTWFNEGLASLHEQCSVGEKMITGHTNWRLPALQRAIADKTLRPLRDLVTKRDFYGRLRGINYAQGRYFAMYVQHRGLLGKFYRRFHGAHKAGRTTDDVKVIEEVFGRKLPEIEKAFIAWVRTLRYGR